MRQDRIQRSGSHDCFFSFFFAQLREIRLRNRITTVRCWMNMRIDIAVTIVHSDIHWPSIENEYSYRVKTIQNEWYAIHPYSSSRYLAPNAIPLFNRRPVYNSQDGTRRNWEMYSSPFCTIVMEFLKWSRTRVCSILLSDASHSLRLTTFYV